MTQYSTKLESKPAVKSKACVGACASAVSAGVGILISRTGLPSEVVAPLVIPLAISLVGSLYSLWGSLTRNTVIGSWF